MDTPIVEETAPLIPNDEISTTVRDTRKPHEKQLAVHLILASILFQYIAFLSLSINLSNNLNSNNALHWTSDHSSTAAVIFVGK